MKELFGSPWKTWFQGAMKTLCSGFLRMMTIFTAGKFEHKIFYSWSCVWIESQYSTILQPWCPIPFRKCLSDVSVTIAWTEPLRVCNKEWIPAICQTKMRRNKHMWGGGHFSAATFFAKLITGSFRTIRCVVETENSDGDPKIGSMCFEPRNFESRSVCTGASHLI